MKYLFILLFMILSFKSVGQIYTTINGDVDFISDAPLEIIKASSDQMQGILDIDRKAFAFKMFIKSFEGFNNPLQQIHFYENYMEVDEFPLAIFKGKIIEPISLNRKKYRAKGLLTIHGVTKEKIVEVQLSFKGNKVEYSSEFSIYLVDHNIELPRIVYQKIAKEIKVNVHGVLNLKE